MLRKINDPKGMIFMTIQELLAYEHWANQTFLDYLETLPDELFTKEIPGVFPSISATFGHIYSAGQTWFKRIKGEPAPLENIVFHSVAEAKKKFTQWYEEIQSYMDQMEDKQVIDYQNTRGQSFQSTIREIVQHLVNHGTYHRGNVSEKLRSQGYQSVSTDFIFYRRTL
jgi:uncharacterized damage-inducible protein DinB